MGEATVRRTVVLTSAAFLSVAVWLVFAALQQLVDKYEHGNNVCERTFRRLQDVHWASVAVGAPVSLAVVVGIVACCCRSSWDAFWRCIDDPCRSFYLAVKALLVLVWILTFAVVCALFAARQRCFSGSTAHAGRLLVSGSAALAATAAVSAITCAAGTGRSPDA